MTESEIESLKEEMKQAMDYMKKRLEDSGLGEELRQRLRKRDM